MVQKAMDAGPVSVLAHPASLYLLLLLCLSDVKELPWVCTGPPAVDPLRVHTLCARLQGTHLIADVLGHFYLCPWLLQV